MATWDFAKIIYTTLPFVTSHWDFDKIEKILKWRGLTFILRWRALTFIIWKILKWKSFAALQMRQLKLSSDGSYQVIKVREVRKAKDVKRSDDWWRFACGDVLTGNGKRTSKPKLTIMDGSLFLGWWGSPHSSHEQHRPELYWFQITNICVSLSLGWLGKPARPGC